MEIENSSQIYLPYQFLTASSQSHDSRVDELSNHSRRIYEPFEPLKDGGWESARFCSWPQEVVIRLDARSQLRHVTLMSKANREIPECVFYIGDGGSSGSFTDCTFRKAGEGTSVHWLVPSQFELFGIGSYLKIVFPRAPKVEHLNLNQQIGIGFLKIFGQPMENYKGLVNEAMPILKGQVNDEVDKVLLEMGIPVSQPALDWSFDQLEREDSVIYAPVDEDTRLTLKDMQKEWIKAHSIQDFERVMSIGKDIKILLGIGNDILKLKRELQLCVAQENYEKAIDIRNQLQANEKVRTNFDMVYETNRFEDMIAMGPPSEQFLREQKLIEMEEQKELERRRKQDQIEYEKKQRELNEERVRRQKELFEQRQREEEEALKAAQEKDRADQLPVNQSPTRVKPANQPIVIGSPGKPSKPRQPRRLPNKPPAPVNVSDMQITPGELNANLTEGDKDLEDFLKKKMKQANGTMRELEKEVKRRPDSEGTLNVCGIRIWNGLHSESWRYRDAAAEAYMAFLTQPGGLPKRYKDSTKFLFAATCELAMMACRDKLLQIYLNGLKMLSEALTPKICGGDIPAKTVDKAIKPFAFLLRDKLSELNYRGRELTLGYFNALFRHPAVDFRHALEAVLDVTEKPTPIEKVSWRILVTRLEIFNSLMLEFGINEEVWEWRYVYHKLIGPAFSHANPDVRVIAIEAAINIFRQVGAALRTEIVNGPAIRPALQQQLFLRMEREAKQHGIEMPNLSPSKRGSPNRGGGLEQVTEAEPAREHTPMGKRR